jgi:hypothetical protein
VNGPYILDWSNERSAIRHNHDIGRMSISTVVIQFLRLPSFLLLRVLCSDDDDDDDDDETRD